MCPDSPFGSIEEAIETIRQGGMVVVVDDEDRENEGDLTLAAEHVSPESVAFMAKYGRGLICAALEGPLLDQLQIPLMVRDNTSPFETAFCVSVEAREGTTTGISAHDRSRTIQALIAPEAKPQHFVKPGHVFPLRARPGGVLTRTGQTEASVDLARLAEACQLLVRRLGRDDAGGGLIEAGQPHGKAAGEHRMEFHEAGPGFVEQDVVAEMTDALDDHLGRVDGAVIGALLDHGDPERARPASNAFTRYRSMRPIRSTYGEASGGALRPIQPSRRLRRRDQ